MQSKIKWVLYFCNSGPLLPQLCCDNRYCLLKALIDLAKLTSQYALSGMHTLSTLCVFTPACSKF